MILVLAPMGRDARVACGLLKDAGLACRSGRGLEDLEVEHLDALGALMLTEELLTDLAIERLNKWLEAQPAWSNIPVVVLSDRTRRHLDAARNALLDNFARHAGVLLLERPISVASFVSVMRAAIATRKRQHQLRDELEARSRAEARARNLAGEMTHRVKNSLALAGAIAQQTFHAGRSLDDALAIYSERLSAMSRAQDLLTARGHANTGLGDLVDQALRPYRESEGSQPFEVDGPQVWLGEKVASTFSMVLHELATNATKYGALSVPSGKVCIRWHEDKMTDGGRQLAFEWRECGGPRVEPPTRRGFGSQLVERALAYELGGTARMAFDPTGLTCTIKATLPPVEGAH